jgi:hypothetical protein
MVDNTVIMWMIRPTMNYMTALLECSINLRDITMNAIKSDFSNVRIECQKMEDKVVMTLTGDGLYRLMNSDLASTLDIKVSACSMGTSTLNVSIIKKQQSGFDVIPVVMNMPLSFIRIPNSP